MSSSPHIAIIAGEASGDTHGAALMQALQKKIPSLLFSGAGGPKMAAIAAQQARDYRLEATEKKSFAAVVEAPTNNNDPVIKLADASKAQEASGAQPRSVLKVHEDVSTATTQRFAATVEFDDWIAEAGVVGLWDVLKKYGYFHAKFSALLDRLEADPPEAIILVDYPGFNLRLAKAIRRRKLPIKIFYYISPQVWAWNKRRIPEMARDLDLMICIFPFEQKIYEASGLPTRFAGHPLVEKLMSLHEGPQGLPREEKLLGLFPGSRAREVHRNFPAMAAAAKQVIMTDPSIRCEAAAATDAHATEMKSLALTLDLPLTVTVGQAQSLMQRASFGLVCSGTATLEAAALGLPYALVYKAAWLTYIIARALIQVPYLGIINILAERPVVREFLQQAATPEVLAQQALHFLQNPEAAAQLSQEVTSIAANLRSQGAYERAAESILEALDLSKKGL